MIRIDLENIIKNSKLYEFLTKQNSTQQERVEMVVELCDEIELEYYKQDGIEVKHE